jgi:hypothetical protein
MAYTAPAPEFFLCEGSSPNWYGWKFEIQNTSRFRNVLGCFECFVIINHPFWGSHNGSKVLESSLPKSEAPMSSKPKSANSLVPSGVVGPWDGRPKNRGW